MELEKIAKINFEETAYYQPISDKNIVFFNLDKNTAKLQFILTKNHIPLLISEENIDSFAFLKSTENRTNSGILKLNIDDPMNGLVSITVPPEFLKSATDTRCLGEIYLSLNDADNKGKDDTVVLGTFKFDVKDSLINKIDSDIKVEYIRMFYDLRETIEQQVEQLKEDIDSTKSIVDEVKQLIVDAIKAINKSKTDSLTEINQAGTDATNSIIAERVIAINEIGAKKESVETEYDLASQKFGIRVENANAEFDEKVTNANQSVDQKIEDFNVKFEKDAFVTSENVDEKLSDLNWQKYKVTNDDGSYELIAMDSDLDAYHNLKPGNYYTTFTPITVASSTAGFTTVITRGSNIVKHIIYRPYNSKQVWMKRFYNTWNDWERIDITQTDTNWISFNLINGAVSNTAYADENSNGFTCAYRILTQGSVKRKMLRINGTNILHNQVIAQLPVDFTEHAQTFPVRIPLKYSGAYIVIRPSGEVKFFINGDSSAWSEEDYAYGQFEWTE